jgi:hypothetical protein
MGLSLLFSLFIAITGPFYVWHALLEIRSCSGQDRSKKFAWLAVFVAVFAWLGLWEGFRIIRLFLGRGP